MPLFLVRFHDWNCVECVVTSNDCFPTDVQQATLDARHSDECISCDSCGSGTVTVGSRGGFPFCGRQWGPLSCSLAFKSDCICLNGCICSNCKKGGSGGHVHLRPCSSWPCGCTVKYFIVCKGCPLTHFCYLTYFKVSCLGKYQVPHVGSAQYFYGTWPACVRFENTSFKKMLSLVLRHIWIVF